MTSIDIRRPDSTDNFTMVSQFLAREALLLDDNEMWQWFDLLADDLDYEIPVREARRRGSASEWVQGSFHMKDTKGSIKHRIDRLYSGKAWAEDSPSRCTRVVGTVMITGERDPGELLVSSNVLIYRERALQPTFEVLAGQRNDVIRITDDGAVLASRLVKLAHTILGTSNLGIFV